MNAVTANASMAATKLIKGLRALPQQHSVWISTEVDLQGNFKEVIMVSLHPKTADKVRPRVPAEQDGYEIRMTPWPKVLT